MGVGLAIRRTEVTASLKKAMLERGMSAEEIRMVMDAGSCTSHELGKQPAYAKQPAYTEVCVPQAPNRRLRSLFRRTTTGDTIAGRRQGDAPIQNLGTSRPRPRALIREPESSSCISSSS